ncbi:hypothetical protein Tco_0204633 [Tanacetum coccineum]
MKRVFISLTSPFEVTRLAIQKLRVRATTIHVHGSSSTATCFIVASISIVPISLVSRHRIGYTLGYQLLDGIGTHSLCLDSNLSDISRNLLSLKCSCLSLSAAVSLSQGLYLMHMDSNLSIALNLLRSGNKSAGREDNVDVAGASVDVGATVANVGTTGVGDLHLLRDDLTDGGDESYNGDGRRDLLRDGPECGGDGGGEDDDGGEGDGDAATH